MKSYIILFSVFNGFYSVHGENFSLYFITEFAKNFIMFGDKLRQSNLLNIIVDDR